jgi:hypothetical protein
MSRWAEAPDLHTCAGCGWSGRDVRWSAVADGFGRYAGECPACARRFPRCYLSVTRVRRRPGPEHAGRRVARGDRDAPLAGHLGRVQGRVGAPHGLVGTRGDRGEVGDAEARSR